MTINRSSPLGSVPITGAAAAAELVPGTRVEAYEIEGKIGEGAMGAVYRAVHPTIGKHVAVKIMNSRLSADPGAIERFTREARSVAAIRHPGIVDVFGFGTLDDGRAYLIMEWLDGTSLGTRLQKGSLGLDAALDIIDQIARALDAAHDKGITHRDLKPDNVFLEQVARERPITKILDFGLAKLAHEEGQASVTQSGQLLGTPIYMSPEQCKGKGVDHRTDIYALGCIAYELICGRVPFDADNMAELIAAHLGEEPPRPSSLWSGIPPQLDRLLFAMLAKDPARRPTLQHVRQTIATTRGSAYPTPVSGTPIVGAQHDSPTAVHPHASTLPQTPIPDPLGQIVTHSTRRRRLLAVAAASVVVAAIVVFFLVGRSATSSDSQTSDKASSGVEEMPTAPTTTATTIADAGMPDATVVSEPPVAAPSVPDKRKTAVKQKTTKKRNNAAKDDHAPASGSAKRFDRSD